MSDPCCPECEHCKARWKLIYHTEVVGLDSHMRYVEDAFAHRVTRLLELLGHKARARWTGTGYFVEVVVDD